MKIEINEIFYFNDQVNKIGDVADYCNANNLLMVEIAADEKGRRYQISEMPLPSEEELKSVKIGALKAELAKIKEDIEQEQFGLLREDYAEKKARAAEIINELRVLEGKEPREVIK